MRLLWRSIIIITRPKPRPTRPSGRLASLSAQLRRIGSDDFSWQTHTHFIKLYIHTSSTWWWWWYQSSILEIVSFSLLFFLPYDQVFLFSAIHFVERALIRCWVSNSCHKSHSKNTLGRKMVINYFYSYKLSIEHVLDFFPWEVEGLKFTGQEIHLFNIS